MASTKPRRRPIQPAALLAACALASLGIAACGGSSSSKDASASNATTNSSTSTTSSSAAGGASRFAALRSCLQKEGITLPERPAGQRPPTGGTGAPRGAFPGGGGGFAQRLPKGVSAEKFQSALKKCGGDFHGGDFRGRGSFYSSSTARKGLTAFATCMNENGVKLPAPNTSGHGPVFDVKGIDTTSTQFKTADAKCSSKLPARPFGGRGGPPPTQSGGA